MGSIPKQWAIGISIVIIALGLLAFLPIAHWRVISSGVDAYNFHATLFNSRHLTQQITSPFPISGVGFIIVDYNKHNAVTDVTVTVTDTATKERLNQTIIPADTIQDDTFAYAQFDKQLTSQNNNFTVDLQAPQADRTSMLGVRFDPEDTQDSQPRFENNQLKPGMFALSIRQHVPLWRFLQYIFQRQATTNRGYFVAAIIAAIIASICLYRVPLTLSKKQRWVAVALIGMLVGIGIASRTAMLSRLGGASGGDPYNYLFIAQNIKEGNNPFSGEKRLPGFPILLTPSLLNQHNDDITVMRLISITAGIATLVMVGVLMRALGLPLIVQLTAPLLIAWQKDFFWTSLRPEPYTWYAFLVAAALTLFFTAKKPWQQVLYGLVLGYAAMTRQEGFMLAAVLGVCSLFMWRTYTNEKQTIFFSRATLFAYLRLYIPALLVVAPFFISNTAAYGNPFFTPYFEGDRLQIVDSWEAFKDNVGATWGVIGSLWRPTWEENERYDLTNPAFLLTMIVALGWTGWWLFSPAAHTRLSQYTWLMTAIIATLSTLVIFQLYSRTFFSLGPLVVAALILISPLALIGYLRWRALPIIAVVISQLLIVVWFHPFVKHAQQILPLISVSLTALLLLPAITTKPEEGTNRLNRLMRFTLTLAILVPLALLTAKPLIGINVMIDKHNANSALDSVTYRAVKTALHYPGPYGADQGYLPARLYFGPDNHYFLGENSTTIEEEVAWVKENGIRTLVVTTDGPAFNHPHPEWQQVVHYKSEGRDERLYESFVYVIPVQ